MRRLSLAIALLLSCTSVPPVTLPLPSAMVTLAPTATPIATASPSPRPLDMAVVPAGEIRGDHALVVQGSLQPGGATSAMRFWDVPLDGTAPKQLVSYNRGEQRLTDWDTFDFSRQLSPDGRQLVLADPVDMAGTGLLVVDLIAGTTRLIRTTGGADQPAWSPDGQRIAYRGYAVATPFFTKESGIWVVATSGGSPQQIWTSDRPAGSGATSVYGWTENGTGIAFSRDFTDVSVVDVPTGNVARIAGGIHGIAWRAKRPSTAIVLDDDVSTPSPSGPRGAPSSIGRAGHVEVRDTTLAAARIVTRYGDVGTVLYGPRWNPTTDEILTFWACGAGATGREELVIVDGVSARRRAVPTSGCVYSASWNGDGTKILYSDIQSLRAMSSDGSNDRELWRPGLPPGAFQQNIGAIIAFAPR